MPCCVLQITYDIKKMMTMDIKKQTNKQNRKSYLYKAKRKMVIKQMIPRGIEPGPAGWKSRSLTTNPQGMSTSVLHEDALLIGILSLCNHRETFQRFTVTKHLNLSLLQYVIMSCQLIRDGLISFVPMDYVSAKTNHNKANFQRFTLSKTK